jgi:N-methylhydantoinase A/oxoprolinase/acetone carboxylase beta subunit
VDAVFREMAEDVARTLRTTDAGGAVAFARAVDVGYIGQGYQVTLAIDNAPESLGRAGLWRRFAETYREKYGYFYDDVAAELVNLRLSGRIGEEAFALAPLAGDGTGGAAAKDERPAFSSRHRQLIPFTVYDRDELRPGMVIRGPAIIEEASATTVVDVDAILEVDRYGSLLIAIRGAA